MATYILSFQIKYFKIMCNFSKFRLEYCIYIFTGPSAPIVEDLRAVEQGLNISWKSDVQTKLEIYEIVHKRNDTGKLE